MSWFPRYWFSYVVGVVGRLWHEALYEWDDE